MNEPDAEVAFDTEFLFPVEPVSKRSEPID